MQTASNGHAQDSFFPEVSYQFFGCELSRITQLVGKQIVVEECVHALAKIEDFRFPFRPQAILVTLLDRYPNFGIHVMNNIVILDDTKTLEHHEVRSTLEVKRLVAQEDPCVRLGDWLLICL